MGSATFRSALRRLHRLGLRRPWFRALVELGLQLCDLRLLRRYLGHQLAVVPDQLIEISRRPGERHGIARRQDAQVSVLLQGLEGALADANRLLAGTPLWILRLLVDLDLDRTIRRPESTSSPAAGEPVPPDCLD